MINTPWSVGTRSMAVLRICSAEGEAKMVPATAASQRPWPTKPAKAGSWPEPPPVTMETLFGLRGASGRRKTILFSTSNARDGLVRVREFSAVRTRWLGSVKKCLAGKDDQLAVFVLCKCMCGCDACTMAVGGLTLHFASSFDSFDSSFCLFGREFNHFKFFFTRMLVANR